MTPPCWSRVTSTSSGSGSRSSSNSSRSSIASKVSFASVQRWRYRRKRTDGTVFWLFLLLHALFRFSIEFLRGDFRGPSLVGGLTTSQGIALLAALLGGGMLLKYHLERESPQIGKK